MGSRAKEPRLQRICHQANASSVSWASDSEYAGSCGECSQDRCECVCMCGWIDVCTHALACACVHIRYVCPCRKVQNTSEVRSRTAAVPEDCSLFGASTHKGRPCFDLSLHWCGQNSLDDSNPGQLLRRSSAQSHPPCIIFAQKDVASFSRYTFEF